MEFLKVHLYNVKKMSQNFRENIIGIKKNLQCAFNFFDYKFEKVFRPCIKINIYIMCLKKFNVYQIKCFTCKLQMYIIY